MGGVTRIREIALDISPLIVTSPCRPIPPVVAVTTIIKTTVTSVTNFAIPTITTPATATVAAITVLVVAVLVPATLGVPILCASAHSVFPKVATEEALHVVIIRWCARMTRVTRVTTNRSGRRMT